MSTIPEPLPPSDTGAEMCLLSSLLLCENNAEVFEAVLAMRPGFYMPDHEVMFSTLATMYQAGRKIDAVTVRAELERTGRLAEIGGTEYLFKLIDSVPAWTHWITYAGIVVDMQQRRNLLALGDALKAQASLPPRDVSVLDIAEMANRRLGAIIENGAIDRYQSIGDVAHEVLDGLGRGEVPFIPSGLAPLDEVIGGFGPGEFWIIGARPSMGKSTLVRNLARLLSGSGVPVGFISLEESKLKMARNALAAESGIENRVLRSGNVGEKEYGAVAHAVQNLSALPLYLSNTARRIPEIRSLAATLKARKRIEVLIVDYLQRVRPSQIADRYSAVTEISLELSDLAKSTGLVVVCPAQLNRAVEGRGDKRPNMSDLRESGQIEQDADGIIFLHREDYYHTDDTDYEPTGIAELIIAKNRDGARGVTVKLKSNLKYQRFEEITADPF